jgi:uncharacterized protein with HEPN domain
VLGVDYAAFREDEQKVYAVVRALEVIGEAARHIPRKLRLKYPEVPWSKMTGMRDKVIHDTFGVDLEVLWKRFNRTCPNCSSRWRRCWRKSKTRRRTMKAGARQYAESFRPLYAPQVSTCDSARDESDGYRASTSNSVLPT